MHDLNNTQPIGGMDMDNDARNLAPMDYVYGLNVRNAINNAGKGGTLTNLKGNVEITKYTMPYSANNALPAGVNRCIGAFEDLVGNTIIYFVFNSSGNHCILRYYRNNTDPQNPYGEIQQIIQYNFGWRVDTRITSASIVYGDEGTGDLLYWLDPEPKKINLTKANICYKAKSWKVVLPVGYAGSSFFFQVVVRNFSNNTNVASINVTVAGGLTITQIFESIAAQINAGLGSYLTATACECSMDIVERGLNLYNILFAEPAFYVVPENWYGVGSSLIDRYFDRCKWQPLFEPVGTYSIDTDYLPNYITEKAFQFRLRYIYDDTEYSAPGVISQVPATVLGCDGSNNTNYNYIDINFNDPNLLLTSTLVLLKSVEVWAFEYGTPDWKRVVTLEPCEFLDRQNGTTLAHYKFYNDTLADTIDTVTSSKLFDNVPLEAGAETFSKNRLIAGDILEGYDAPDCVKASYTIDFEDTANVPLYKVTFRVRVFNFKLDNNSTVTTRTIEPNILERRSGIFYDDLEEEDVTYYPYFGGVTIAGGTANLYTEAQTVFKQLLPEGGWPVYAAGTSYFGVSKQIQGAGLTQRADGSIDITGNLNTRDFVRQYYQDGNDIYSVVEIRVPAGKYVFRIGSHYCSFGDKLGKGSMYDLNNGQAFHQTSTYVWGTNVGGTWSVNKEITVDVNADVFAGEFVIADATYQNTAGNFTNALAIAGYLRDASGNTDVDSLQQGVSVEKALIEVTGLTAPSIGIAETNKCWTDHNGFFFIFMGYPINLTALRLYAYQIQNGGVYTLKSPSSSQYLSSGKSAIDDLLNAPIDLVPNVGLGVGYQEYIVPTTTPNGRLNSSTFLTGTVVNSSGNPVPDVVIVYQNGRVTVTNNDGEFNLLAWNDMQQLNLVPVNQRIVDNLIVNFTCSGGTTYPNGNEFTITMSPFNPTYTPTTPYVVTGIIVDNNGGLLIKARKRGGNYSVGLRYYDYAGRLCSVAEAFDIYIPFITEDLNRTLPNQYAPNTFKYGAPTINWALDPTFQPPVWAAYYQWVFSNNKVYGRYLQWVINEATYLSEISDGVSPEVVTAFENGDAVAVKLSISNIVDFARTNPKSQISYSYENGDRVRLVADRNYVYYDGVDDLEVVSFDTTTQSLIVKLSQFTSEILSGTYIEIFNPKSVSDDEQQIYYEVGEVFTCTAPGSTTNQHSVLSGTFTNGDTYWRKRTILVNDDQNNFASVYPLSVEDASISDFYPSQMSDNGRPGIVDPNFTQKRNPVLMRFTDEFLAVDNNINGLSTYQDLNYLELDRAYGAIKGLIFTQNTLVIIGANREISQYLGQTTLQQGTTVNSGLVALSSSFFGAPYVHSRMLGTDYKGSLSVHDGLIFALANYLGNAWRYQGDGELRISDVKMASYFNGLKESGIKEAVSIYDRYHEEYTLTVWRYYRQDSTVTTFSALPSGYSLGVLFAADAVLPTLSDTAEVQYYNGTTWAVTTGIVTGIVQNYNETGQPLAIIRVNKDYLFTVGTSVRVKYSLPETLCWFNGNDATAAELRNKWASFRSYTPEQYGRLASEIVSFQNGRLWLHDKNPLWNNFYGVQYDTRLTPVFNMQPLWLKVWNACTLAQLQANGANDWSAPNIYNENGQQSRLVKGSWTKKGENWYAAFRRDLNDLTIPANVRISQGRSLRSSSLTCELVNDYTGEIKLYLWQANWTPSERTTK